MPWYSPFSLRPFVGCFLFVVRKLQFVVARFLIMNVTGVTALQLPELLYENIVAFGRNVVYGAAYADLLCI